MADTRVEELRRRLERDPGSRLFAQLAEELRKAGDLVEAIRVARAGLAVHSSYASARLTLGRALLESGEAAAARVELESALRDAPDNILASRFLAQAREALGDLAGAAEQYRRTLQMAPGDRQLQGALAGVEARLGSGSAGAGPSVAPAPALSAAPAAPARPAAPPRPEPSAPAPRRSAPPVVFSEPEPELQGEGGELPPTVRIHSSQAGAGPQGAPSGPPAAGSAGELRTQGADVRTLPPPPVSAPAVVAAAPPSPPPPPAAAPAATETTLVPEAPTLPPQPERRLAPEPAGEGPPAAGTAAQEATAPFSSSTLAELYYQQGLVDRAIDVYRQLVEQDPDNGRARARLAELEAVGAGAVAGAGDAERAARRRALERTIAGLEQLLVAVRRR